MKQLQNNGNKGALLNIFVLDEDPKKAAQYHCDKHVVKMILETAQLLSTTCKYYGIDYGYRKTHINHPCSVWLREGVDNIKWTIELGNELLVEYSKRYKKTHKSKDVIEHFPIIEIQKYTENVFTPFKLAMPNVYKTENAVSSYRQYYINEKANIASWKFSETPPWWEIVTKKEIK